MSYSTEQIGQLICMPFDLGGITGKDLSEREKLYFFRLEHLLLVLDGESGLDYANHDSPHVRFKSYCLQEGIDLYHREFMKHLRGLSDTEWEQVLRYTSWYNREKDRKVPIGMSPEEVEEGLALLKRRLRMKQVLFGNSGFGES